MKFISSQDKNKINKFVRTDEKKSKLKKIICVCMYVCLNKYVAIIIRHVRVAFCQLSAGWQMFACTLYKYIYHINIYIYIHCEPYAAAAHTRSMTICICCIYVCLTGSERGSVYLSINLANKTKSNKCILSAII